MSWLINDLNRRILFMELVQTPDTTGDAVQTYKQVARCWAGCKPVGTSAGSYVRNVQVEDAPTHTFKVRRNTRAGIDVYGAGVVKSENFIFLLGGNQPTVGRVFRILKASNAAEADEYLEILAKEIGQLDTTKGVIR